MNPPVIEAPESFDWMTDAYDSAAFERMSMDNGSCSW
jgi:hypothetical protein